MNKCIALFFTHGVSLALWDRRGMFSREVRLYQALAEHVGEVWFFTYGRGDEKYQDRLGPHIRLFAKRLPIPNIIYAFFLPLFYWKQLKRADILRIHQMAGAIPALIARWIVRKPLIVRCGYQWSKFLTGQSAPFIKRRIVWCIEWIAYRASTAIIVTTASDIPYVAERYRVSREKMHVIHNYVDTELFKPIDIMKIKKRVCFVGRLEPQKNLKNLIEAFEGADAQLLFFGDGSLKKELKQLADKKNILLVIRDPIPNNQLPQELNQCELFILPSFYEGNPKSLLEAMACGLPVIGADVDGIKDIIDHERNGFLCKTDSELIRGAIIKLLSSPDERRRLGEGARESILSTHSLSNIINKELEVLHTLTV